MEDPSGTKCKRASKALWKSEEYFKAIIQNSSDVILVLDKLGTITYASPSVEYVLGYRTDELIGKRSLDLIVSDDKPRAIADFGRALLIKEALIPNVFRMRHKDGTERILDGVGSNLLDNPIVAGFVMNVHDITERKRAEEALESERTLLRSLIDNVPDRIYAKDPEGRFIICNEAMIRRMGMTSMTELVGKSDFDFLPLEMAQRFRTDEQAIIQSGTSMINREEPLTTEGGTITRWNLATKVPLLDKQGNRIGIVGVGREITDLKQADQKLKDTLEKLRKAISMTIQAMISAVETRDPYTAGHQTRSADLARAIATEMGLPHDKIEGVRMAGSIHDIGKLSIPAEILSKPTKLSELEFSLIKEHARQGYEILKNVESSWPLAEMVYQHHERMDGSGYPRHLKGDDILMEARIMAVADVVEAMSSHRPYRPGLGIEAALGEISKNRGILYDPEVSDACLKLFQEKGYRFN